MDVELARGGTRRNVRGVALAPLLSAGQRRSAEYTGSGPPYRSTRMYVPVVDGEGTPLMPTVPSRARRWVKAKRAAPCDGHAAPAIRLAAPAGSIGDGVRYFCRRVPSRGGSGSCGCWRGCRRCIPSRTSWSRTCRQRRRRARAAGIVCSAHWRDHGKTNGRPDGA